MTRREDPVWGEPEEAALGNNDSMHVTNTVPQMQPFNGGIWLALESYALDHARIRSDAHLRHDGSVPDARRSDP
jgi:endonuclease G